MDNTIQQVKQNQEVTPDSLDVSFQTNSSSLSVILARLRSQTPRAQTKEMNIIYQNFNGQARATDIGYICEFIEQTKTPAENLLGGIILCKLSASIPKHLWTIQCSSDVVNTIARHLWFQPGNKLEEESIIPGNEGKRFEILDGIVKELNSSLYGAPMRVPNDSSVVMFERQVKCLFYLWRYVTRDLEIFSSSKVEQDVMHVLLAAQRASLFMECIDGILFWGGHDDVNNELSILMRIRDMGIIRPDNYSQFVMIR